MGDVNSSGSCVVRPGASATSRTVVCVLAFLATGAAVLWLTSHGPQEKKMNYSATATAWHQPSPSSELPDGTMAEPSRPDVATVERQMLSDENLRRALAQVASRADGGEDGTRDEPSPTVEQVRRAVRVTAVEAPGDGLSIAVSYSDGDPDRVVRLVNALASGYAEAWEAQQKASGNREYLEAQEAAERARHEYLEVKGRFDDFIKQHFLEQQTLADRAAQDATEHRREPAPEIVPTPLVTEAAPPLAAREPERVDLERRLAGLQQDRALLLTIRTPLHPEVRYTDVRIAEVLEQLASMPPVDLGLPGEVPLGVASEVLPTDDRLAPPKPSVEGPPSTTKGVPFAEMGDELREAAEEFRVQKEALDRAEKEYDRLADAKRRAWDTQVAGPTVRLELAERGEAHQPARAPQGSALVALATALAVALGVGLISSGFDVDLPLVSVAEAEAALPVPVVGTIPSTAAASTGISTGAAQLRSRRTRIAVGVLLIGACFAILVAVF